MEPAVQLLSTTIADNVTDHQSKQFAEQLLHITIDYLHVVVRNVTLIRQQVGAVTQIKDISIFALKFLN